MKTSVPNLYRSSPVTGSDPAQRLRALCRVNLIPASLNTAQTKPEQSYRLGPVEPYKYGIPNRRVIPLIMSVVADDE
jgi:hypothetical protein